jgi:uncharacterized membrane protein YbhN (UPF0104 family)
MSQDTRSSRTSLFRWLGTAISLALMVYLISTQGWTEIWQSIRSIPPLYFALAVGLMFISRLAVIGRWYTLLKAADQNLPIRDTVQLVFAGLFASNFLPTTIGGDVIRLAGAVKRKLDPPVVTASLLADRLIGVIGMTSLLPVGLPYLLAVKDTVLLRGPLSAISIIASRETINKWFARGRAFIASTMNALLIWFKRPTSLVLALLWTYGHQVALFTTIWALFQGMGQSISWWTVAGLWVFNYYISMLPISINGFGVQELSIAYVFDNFGGVSTESALVMAILVRLLYMLASLPGVISLPEIIRVEKKKNPRPDGVYLKSD